MAALIVAIRGILRKKIGSRFRSGGGDPQIVDWDVPRAGEIYAFRTSPLSEFAAPETGRHAAFKIVGVDKGRVSVAVLDGIWTTRPSLDEAKKTKILLEHRFNSAGRPAVFGVNRDWWVHGDLKDVEFVGKAAVSKDERTHANAIASFAVGSRHTTLRGANRAAEGEWRWDHDQQALIAESGLVKAKGEAERAAKEERYRTRLGKLTWEQLLAEVPFERWSPSPPYPPEDFTLEARNTIRNACQQLSELGRKPRKAAVRAILKSTVKWFNEADERAGSVIETEEREDICAVLEEMAYVARQKSLVDEIDGWREW